jgi:hypothetical protein
MFDFYFMNHQSKQANRILHTGAETYWTNTIFLIFYIMMCFASVYKTKGYEVGFKTDYEIFHYIILYYTIHIVELNSI